MSMFFFGRIFINQFVNLILVRVKCTSSLYPIVFIQNMYFDTNNFILCTIFVCSDDKPSKNVLFIFIIFFYIFYYFNLCFMSGISRHSRSLLRYHN